MKYSVLSALFTLGLFLGGCAHEAAYVDKEHGLASNAAFDQQIVNKDYKYADKAVVGMEALHSENIMGKYSETYKDGFTKEKFGLGSFEAAGK